MVKAVGLSDDEVRQRRRFDKLVDIACDIMSDNGHAQEMSGAIVAYPDKTDTSCKNSLIVHPDSNIIYTFSEKVLQDAIKLGKAYESSGEPEFTVKKNYVEYSGQGSNPCGRFDIPIRVG